MSFVYSSLSRFLVGVLLIALVSVWVNQQSLNHYFQQKYHQASPLEALDSYAIWRHGDAISQVLLGWKQSAIGFLSPSNREDGLVETNRIEPELAQSFADFAEKPVSQTKESVVAQPNLKPLEASSNPPEPTQAPPKHWTIKSNQKVLFVGDSLMQGVAPHIMSALKKQHGIESLNLSKQSTGLTYLRFFNWPLVIQDTLYQNDDVALMVVMLGANDPWDIPVKKGQPYLRFKTPEWTAIYRARISLVLQLAAQRNVKVIWIGAPTMQKKNLSDGIKYLNSLYEDEIKRHQGIFLSANASLGYDNDDEFEVYNTRTEPKIKIRSDDGIHFTPTGQRMVAQALLSLVNVE